MTFQINEVEKALQVDKRPDQILRRKAFALNGTLYAQCIAFVYVRVSCAVYSRRIMVTIQIRNADEITANTMAHTVTE